MLGSLPEPVRLGAGGQQASAQVTRKRCLLRNVECARAGLEPAILRRLAAASARSGVQHVDRHQARVCRTSCRRCRLRGAALRHCLGGALALFNLWPGALRLAARGPSDWGFIALTGFLTFTRQLRPACFGRSRPASVLRALRGLAGNHPGFRPPVRALHVPDRRTAHRGPKSPGSRWGWSASPIIFSGELHLAGTGRRCWLAVRRWWSVPPSTSVFVNVLIKAPGGRHLDPAMLSRQRADDCSAFCHCWRWAAWLRGGALAITTGQSHAVFDLVLSRAGGEFAGLLPAVLVGAAGGGHPDHADFAGDAPWPPSPSGGGLRRARRSRGQTPCSGGGVRVAGNGAGHLPAHGGAGAYRSGGRAAG